MLLTHRVHARARVLDGADRVVRDDRHAGELLQEEDDDDEHEGLPDLGPPQLLPVGRRHSLPPRPLFRRRGRCRRRRAVQRLLEALELGVALRRRAGTSVTRPAAQPLDGREGGVEATFETDGHFAQVGSAFQVLARLLPTAQGIHSFWISRTRAGNGLF